MIKGLRVDHRLLHGQVAVSWFNTTGADTILIANDEVANDESRKTIMRIAKPSNAKLVMKDLNYCIDAINGGLTDKYEMLVVVESISDAYKLIKGTEVFKSLNLGGTRPTNKTKSISKTINVTEEEVRLLNGLVEDGIEVEIRQLPTDKKIYFENTI